MKPSNLAKFAEHLARTDYEAVGFLPRPRLEQYEAAGQILAEEENGELCGVVVFGNGHPTLKIYQAIIQYDARRMEHGLNLVARVMDEAAKRHCDTVSLWCADDLPANDFWQAAGFTRIGQRAGGTKRGRKHNLWVRAVPTSQFVLWRVA